MRLDNESIFVVLNRFVFPLLNATKVLNKQA